MAESASPSPQQPSPLNVPTRDLSGRQLGDYRLLRRLGQGAMAEVYLAEQISLQRNVALKVLRADLADDETYIRRFSLEAQAAASLVHTNIVQVYEVGHVDGVHYIAQEYVAGANLQQHLRRKGPPGAGRAIQIMRQVAAALEKAGDAGIVHRDIKPDNVMLTRDGEVKVADFGLARNTAAGKSVDLTQVGVTMGTPLYMSPEQVEGGRLDTRSDIYSFGVTCFHMLAGRPPFEGETSLAVAVQHLNKQPPWLADARPDLPDLLCQIVHRMLAKRPDERYQSAAAIIEALDQFDTNGTSTDRQLGPWSLADTGSGTAATSGAAATQQLTATGQLAAVMRREATMSPTRRRGIIFALAVLMAMLGGCAIARLTQQTFLLDGDGSESEQFVDSDELFAQAMMSTDPDDAEFLLLDFVESNPDPDDWRYLYALQELIMLALEGRDNHRALELCDRLIREAPGSHEESRAFGQAGRIVGLYQLDQPDRAMDELFDFWNNKDNLEDDRLNDWLDYVEQGLEDRGGEGRADAARDHVPTPSGDDATTANG
jgi:tRNA A-37 threonylcarbamoyl transferase component Bud32